MKCRLYPWYLFLVHSVDGKFAWYSSSTCMLLVFFSRSWKSSLDVTLAEDRFIWLIYWPCGSGGASPKHGGLIDPTVSQTSGLFVVNYRIKAFSGSSSRTVHVLALVKLVYFLASNEMTIAVQVLVSRFPCLFAMNSHSTHASNRDETKIKKKACSCAVGLASQIPKRQQTARGRGR